MNGLSNFKDDGSVAIVLIITLITLAWYLAPIILSAVIADKKGRSIGGWICCTLFLGWISVIIIACLSSNRAPQSTTESTSRVLHHIPKEQKYESFNCTKCGERINTRRCAYCGYEHNAKSLKRTPAFTATKLTQLNNWICSCGAVNPESSKECNACFKPKGK